MTVEIKVNRSTLVLLQGDITAMETDAIVNAANGHLAHGGGVAGAIALRGGYAIQRESDAWVREHGPVSTGSAAITSGGQLPARYVIHAVGPVYDSGAPEQSAVLLAAAVRSSLTLADQYELKTITLPAISTGVFGYPLESAARVMIQAAVDYLEGQTALERVQFCLYGQAGLDAFVEAMSEFRDS